ncbi:MAG: transposase [Thaumarchaeota archaeon]|nr:transposase [Nitrososphaerota archaeon]
MKGRIYKCPNCGMEYDRDLNACVNIAHRVTSSMGWRSSEPLEPANEEIGVKPTLNAGSSRLQSWRSSPNGGAEGRAW